MAVAPGTGCGSVPVEHLDYTFIQNCSDPKQLERILRVLQSNRDGSYPHLTQFCEEHLKKIHPQSRVLRKDKPVATAASFSEEEWRKISEDIEMWENSIRTEEAQLNHRQFSDKEMVPVRSSASAQQHLSGESVLSRNMSTKTGAGESV